MRVLIWAVALVFVAGCFGRPDIGRIRIDPETGSELVENFKDKPFSVKELVDAGMSEDAARKLLGPPKPGSPDFVGPIDPSTDPTFKEGKAAAKADFNQSVKVLTWWACAACIVGGAFMLVASFFLPWASTKLAAYCLAGAGLTLITRYVLLTYGTITADIAFWIMVATAIGAGALVGLPALIAYIRRIDWKKGQHLAEENHTEAATALFVTADPTLMPIRKKVEQWLVDLKGDIPEVATEARMQLVKLGVLKPGDK